MNQAANTKSLRDATPTINGYAYQRWKGVLLCLDYINNADVYAQEEGKYEDITLTFDDTKATYQYKYSAKTFTAQSKFEDVMPLFDCNYEQLFTKVQFIVGVYTSDDNKSLWPKILTKDRDCRYDNICKQIARCKQITSDKKDSLKYPGLQSFDNLSDKKKRKFINNTLAIIKLNENLTKVITKIETKIQKITSKNMPQEIFYIRYSLYDALAKNLGNAFNIKQKFDKICKDLKDLNDSNQVKNKCKDIIEKSIIGIDMDLKSLNEIDPSDLSNLSETLFDCLSNIQTSKLENDISIDNLELLLSIYDSINYKSKEYNFKKLQDIIVTRIINLINQTNDLELQKKLINIGQRYNSYTVDTDGKIKGTRNKRWVNLTKLGKIEPVLSKDQSKQ